MNTVAITKTYNEPPFCESEILRYAGCKEADSEISALLQSCINEAKDKLIYKVCYRELAVNITGDLCDFEVFTVKSQNLAANLKDANTVILFGATVGVELDRLIAKYSRISPSKAVMLQAIGAQRIEALCDTFCYDIAREKKLNPCLRFSPGYGDLPLTVQTDIFAVLDCQKRIGLTLNNSLLMSPSKSVTAFFGLTDKATNVINKCSLCTKADCDFKQKGVEHIRF